MKLSVRRSPLAVMLALLVLLSPLTGIADVEGGAQERTGFNFSKALDLVGCAAAIATVETGVGLFLASVVCAKAAADWWQN